MGNKNKEAQNVAAQEDPKNQYAATKGNNRNQNNTAKGDSRNQNSTAKGSRNDPMSPREGAQTAGSDHEDTRQRSQDLINSMSYMRNHIEEQKAILKGNIQQFRQKQLQQEKHLKALGKRQTEIDKKMRIATERIESEVNQMKLQLERRREALKLELNAAFKGEMDEIAQGIKEGEQKRRAMERDYNLYCRCATRGGRGSSEKELVELCTAVQDSSRALEESDEYEEDKTYSKSEEKRRNHYYYFKEIHKEELHSAIDKFGGIAHHTKKIKGQKDHGDDEDEDSQQDPDQEDPQQDAQPTDQNQNNNTNSNKKK